MARQLPRDVGDDDVGSKEEVQLLVRRPRGLHEGSCDDDDGSDVDDQGSHHVAAGPVVLGTYLEAGTSVY